MLEPKDKKSDRAVVLEFKIYNERKESNIDEAADAALKQIYEKRYKEDLLQRGVSEDRIYCYGVAFKGKQVVIKMGK